MRFAAPNPASGPPLDRTRTEISEGGSYRFVDADAALVSSLRAKDPRAFDVLVKRHQGRLFTVAQRITNNREDAEDAVQETFLNVLKHLDNFRGDSSFVTWMTRISINEALMTKRAKPRRTTSLDEDHDTGITAFEVPAGGYTPEELCSQNEFEQLLFARIAGMNKRLRQVWRLRIVEDLAEKEIAHALGLSISTVKSRIFRARRHLQKRMRKHFFSARVCANTTAT